MITAGHSRQPGPAEIFETGERFPTVHPQLHAFRRYAIASGRRKPLILSQAQVTKSDNDGSGRPVVGLVTGTAGTAATAIHYRRVTRRGHASAASRGGATHARDHLHRDPGDTDPAPPGRHRAGARRPAADRGTAGRGHRRAARQGRPGDVRPGLRQHRGVFLDDHLPRRRAGILRYRGYPIEQLAERSTLPRGGVPADQRRAADASTSSTTSRARSPSTRCCTRTSSGFFDGFPRDAHPMAMLSSAVSALSTFYQD